MVGDIIALVRRAGAEGRRIFVCGNGGNASNAAHFATDLGKGASDRAPRPFKVLSLADNVAWMTAIGNDYSFDDLFVRQLGNQAEPGDVVMLSSVSGTIGADAWARSATSAAPTGTTSRPARRSAAQKLLPNCR